MCRECRECSFRPFTASGDIDITCFDNDTYSQLGSFNAQITGLDVMGSFNGALNPGPERVAELSQTPEPSYYAAVGALLFVLAALRFGLRRGGRVTLPS